MNLTIIDLIIIVVYFVFVLGIGFAVKRYMKTSTTSSFPAARFPRGSLDWPSFLPTWVPRKSSGWAPRARSMESQPATSTG